MRRSFHHSRRNLLLIYSFLAILIRVTLGFVSYPETIDKTTGLTYHRYHSQPYISEAGKFDLKLYI
jgi:hypothetical protein